MTEPTNPARLPEDAPTAGSGATPERATGARCATTAVLGPAGAIGEIKPDAVRGVSLIGQRIGGFVVQSLLKATGMSEVYVALQVSPGRRVALKVMRGGLPGGGGRGSRSPAFMRFSNEAEIIARLRHPHIAHVYEAGLFTPPPAPGDPADGTPASEPYFAMLYVPGAQPITAYARAMELSVEQRLKLMVRVCDAVHHAHRQGVIHRDIKPGNVLVDESGEPYVIDFGVAFAVGLMPRAVREDEQGAVVGTPSYLSPEQTLRDPDRVDHRCDVYALGVLLYELLVGRHPLDLPTSGPTERTLEIIRRGEIRDPARENPSLRGDLADILRGALAADREARYPSAERLKLAIERVLELRASPPPGSGPPRVVRSELAAMARRRPVLARLMLVLALAVVCQGLLPRVVAQLTPAQRWFESAMLRLPPAPWSGDALGPSAPAHGAGAGLDAIRVVHVSPAMDARALARAAGVSDGGSTKLVWRRVFAAAVDRLVADGAAAVAVMGRFIDDEGLEPLVRSVAAANGSGTPVWVRSPDWSYTPGRDLAGALVGSHVAPVVSDIEPGVRWSAVLAFKPRGSAGEMKLALPLAMYAALSRRDAAVEALTPDPSDRGLVLRYSVEDPSAPRLQRSVVRSERIGVSAVAELPESAEGGPGLAVYQAVVVPGDAELAAAMVPLAEVLDGATPESQRRSRVAGRAVFLVDVENTEFVGLTPDGRRVSTEWIAPLATQSLHSGACITWPGPGLTWPATIAGAALGVVGVWGLAAWRPGFGAASLGGLMLCLTGLLLAGSLLAFWHGGVMLNPLVPAATMLVAGCVAAMLPPGRWPTAPRASPASAPVPG